MLKALLFTFLSTQGFAGVVPFAFWKARAQPVSCTLGWCQQAYLKAPNAGAGDTFGYSTSISGDTIVVGAWQEASNQTFITNGTTASADNSIVQAGAAYVFRRTGTDWISEAYLKAPNAGASDNFGYSTSISGDTIVVGAYGEDSNQTFITNGTSASSDNSELGAGAAYVFFRSGTTWVSQAYLKAPNTNASDFFGASTSISSDTIIVGANEEDSNQTFITNGTAASADNSALNAGAAYVFFRSGTTWVSQAYLKAPNAQADDEFGKSLSISDNTIVIGANLEDSNQTFITNGAAASADNSALNAGAAYVFFRSGTTWVSQAYLKAPNAQAGDSFGISAWISGDTIVVGANQEDSNQTFITNGTTASSNNSAGLAGAAYVFSRTGTIWVSQAYLKAPNARANDFFGISNSISGDTIVVGSDQEDSNQTFITNGTTASADNTASNSGAAYVFKRTGTNWASEAYLKAPNAQAGDSFGISAWISGDTIVVGAYLEDSNQTFITNGTTASSDDSALEAGAAYVFTRPPPPWVSQAYLKAPNAGANDWFGVSAAIYGDTIVVGASQEASSQSFITNGTLASADNSFVASGAAYVFYRTGTIWVSQAYLKAPNPDASDFFGCSASIFGDTIVVGARQEASNQTFITNGTIASADNSIVQAGAAYVFKRTGTNWASEAYLKAPNPGAGDTFGRSVSISGDTIVVGADLEDSNQTFITNGTTASADNSLLDPGAAYVFSRSGTTWVNQAYLKAPNAGASDQFGYSTSISGDTIVVSAIYEDSNQTFITNGTTASADNSLVDPGAAYVFSRTGTTWISEAYLKTPNTGAGDFFGVSASISGDTIVVGAQSEDSNQTFVTNGTTASADNSVSNAGAVYIFKRTGTAWASEAYLKAPNAGVSDFFGFSNSISGDTLVIGARGEDSNQTFITNGTTASADNSALTAGAAYVFKRTGTTWASEAYLKAPNAGAGDTFGYSTSISGDTVVVGAYQEASNQTFITNGTTASADNSAAAAGAAYVFER